MLDLTGTGDSAGGHNRGTGAVSLRKAIIRLFEAHVERVPCPVRNQHPSYLEAAH